MRIKWKNLFILIITLLSIFLTGYFITPILSINGHDPLVYSDNPALYIVAIIGIGMFATVMLVSILMLIYYSFAFLIKFVIDTDNDEHNDHLGV